MTSTYSEEDWVVGGDFNAVKDSREIKDGTLYNSRTDWREFAKFIDRNNFVDVPSKEKSSLGSERTVRRGA